MSIKFICSCGKHLRARDEMAARRSMCPRCGKPVGIPSMRPTHAGTAAEPLSPLERLRVNRDRPSMDAASGAASASRAGGVSPLSEPSGGLRPPLDKPPTRTPKVRRRRQLEQRWHQCLVYSFLNVKVFICFAVILALGLMGLILTVQTLPPFTGLLQKEWISWAFAAFVVGLLAAYAYAAVECALTSALAGEGAAPCWPGLRIAFPLTSAARAIFCFFAGPIIPAGIAVYFWFYGGDLKMLDWLILVELGIFAAAYWLLAIVSANEHNRLRDANPRRVALLVQRLKLRALVPVFLAPALVVSHVLVGLIALPMLHQELLFAWLLLAGCCGNLLFWSAFVFRLLGVWCYYVPLR